MPGTDAARHEAFQKARKEQMEKMKATREKAEKLVKEYNGLKKAKRKTLKNRRLCNWWLLSTKNNSLLRQNNWPILRPV
jgi:hypothetical protein